MPDDILTKIDRAITHQSKPDADRCGECRQPLRNCLPSLDFCSQACQERWGLRRTAGYARDEGRGFPGESERIAVGSWGDDALRWDSDAVRATFDEVDRILVRLRVSLSEDLRVSLSEDLRVRLSEEP